MNTSALRCVAALALALLLAAAPALAADTVTVGDLTLVNKAAFAALDKPTQDAIRKAAADAEQRGWKVWQDKSKWYLEQLAAKGMKVLPPSPELKAGMRKIGLHGRRSSRLPRGLGRSS